MNFLSKSRTFLRYKIIFSPLASSESFICFTSNWAAHLQLICFHEVGEVKSSYDSLIFDLVIGGLVAESEGVFPIYPVWRGQDQTCTASLGIGGPVDG